MNRFDHDDRTPSGSGRRPPRRSRAGEPVSPTRRTRAAASRTRATTPRHASSPTPATVWTVHPAPGDLSGTWPLAVVDRVVAAFSAPGDRITLVPPPAAPFTRGDASTTLDGALDAALEIVLRADRTGVVADPPAATARRAGPASVRPPLPYWADVFHAAHPASPLADTGEGGQGTDNDDPDHRPADDAPVTDLVIASIGPDTPLGDHFGLACAKLLRTAGTLVVLTHSSWTRGRLVDPTGPIVAAAQNADLLYLQHIVVVHAAVRDASLAIESDSPLAEDEQRGQHRAAVRGLPAPHCRIHTDLLIFAQPRDHDPTPPSPATAAFETGVIR